MSLDTARHREHAKYVRAYATGTYGMSEPRMADAVRDLAAMTRGSYLDVGCGRGEMLRHAERLGFAPVQGVEVVPALIDGARVRFGEVHALPFPDKSWDVASLLDVIEHLVPGDDEAACRELARVTRGQILLTANNRTSQKCVGEELHINRREYETWNKLFIDWFAPARVTWLKGKREHVSEAWGVDL